mgnify:CR=1 FL=1
MSHIAQEFIYDDGGCGGVRMSRASPLVRRCSLCARRRRLACLRKHGALWFCVACEERIAGVFA